MKVIFFDTETNGLPHSRKAPETLVENWPFIVSLAWRVYDVGIDSMTMLTEQYSIVSPREGMTWSQDSQNIHGISLAKATVEGKPIREVLAMFKADSETCVAIVAHNLAFDRPVLLSELQRSGLSVSCWPAKQYCTMDSTKGLCKLPSKFSKPADPYKFPKLSELHSYLFGNAGEFTFHSALDDVRCLVKCFEELHFRRLVPLDDWALSA